MPISIIDNFQVNKLGPIDVRMIATNSTARNAIQYKYDGLKVFQTDNRINYTWNASASNWDIDSSGALTGTGSTGFMSSWSSQNSLGNTPVYSNVSGSLSGFPIGIVGINTPPTGTLSPKGIFQINTPFAGAASPTVITKGTITTLSENWYSSVGDQVFDASRGSTLLDFDISGSLIFRVRSGGSPASSIVRAMSIRENGNVIIGPTTSTPSERLFVDGNSRVNGRLIVGPTTSTPSERLFVDGNARISDLRTRNTWVSGGLLEIGITGSVRRSYIDDASDYLRINRTTNNGIAFATNNIDRVRIESSGELTVGSGIKFPSTQNVSTNPNTLDDYEEGTISCNLTSRTSGNAEFSIITTEDTMNYIKIGRSVTISGKVVVSSNAQNGNLSTSNLLYIKLPFNASGSSAASLRYSNFANNFDNHILHGYTTGGDNILQFCAKNISNQSEFFNLGRWLGFFNSISTEIYFSMSYISIS